jgi:hypothetical protein
MNKTIESLKLAEEALNRSCGAISVLAGMGSETAQKLLEENVNVIDAIREALAQEEKLPDNCEWVEGAVPPKGERVRIQANGEHWFVKNGKYYRCIAEHKPEPIVIRTTAPVTYNEGTKYAATFNGDAPQPSEQGVRNACD